MLIENVQLMNQSARSHSGMDMIIITVDTAEQLYFWEKRLAETKESITPAHTKLVVVQENWNGPAGNGLGTLSAYLAASEKFKRLFGIDLIDSQKKGAAVAMYHAIGQGSRLYPLAGSEYGNKSAVKLPGFIQTKSGKKQLITLLEAVIKQTSIYAPYRKGRLSVFWGDQLFVPAKTIAYKPLHHIDLLVKQIPTPSEKEWNEKHLKNYGLVFLDSFGKTKIAEKIPDFTTFKDLFLSQNHSSKINLGVSLGAFSLSLDIIQAFLQEFRQELKDKKLRFESDLHFWMPMTLDLPEFLALAKQKGIETSFAQNHYKRIHSFKQVFFSTHPELDSFGWVNTGRHSYFWDFGSIDTYFENLHKLTKANQESDALRMFFNIYQDTNTADAHLLEKDPSSSLQNCHIQSGRIRNSLLVGVTAEHIDVQDCVIINATFSTFQGHQNLLYNVIQQKPLKLSPETVRADVILSQSKEQIIFYTQKGRVGKEDWETTLAQNSCSYQEIRKRTEKENLLLAEDAYQQLKENVETQLSLSKQ